MTVFRERFACPPEGLRGTLPTESVPQAASFEETVQKPIRYGTASLNATSPEQFVPTCNTSPQEGGPPAVPCYNASSPLTLA